MGDDSGASSAFNHKGVPTRLKYTKVLKTNDKDTGNKKVKELRLQAPLLSQIQLIILYSQRHITTSQHHNITTSQHHYSTV